MTYPYPQGPVGPGPFTPPSHPAKRPVSAVDLTVSILTMVLILVLGAAASIFGLFSLAFLDHCPPATCSAEGAAGAVLSALGIAGLVGATGIIVAIVQLVRRRPSWPFAVGTLVLCVAVLAMGGIGYVAAVGG